MLSKLLSILFGRKGTKKIRHMQKKAHFLRFFYFSRLLLAVGFLGANS